MDKDNLNIIDRKDEEDAVLIKVENDIFKTVFLVYHLDEENEEVYVLGDMQSPYYPESFEEVPDYEWYNINDVAW